LIKKDSLVIVLDKPSEIFDEDFGVDFKLFNREEYTKIFTSLRKK